MRIPCALERHMKREYSSHLLDLARQMRKDPTVGESILWQALRQRKVLSYSFRRQFTIKHFILDFYCRPLKLALEVDGGIHRDINQNLYDKLRQEELESLGIMFLRFEDNMICRNADSAITQIKDWINEHAEPSSFASPP